MRSAVHVFFLMGAALGLAGCDEPAAPPSSPAPVASAPAPDDGPPPRFPEGATLRADAPGVADGTPRTVSLHWESAEGAVRYEVRVGPDRSETTDTSLPLDDVVFDPPPVFSVVALSETGARSAALETRDALAPWFEEGARVRVRSVEDGARLRWPAAEDDVAVTGYVLEMNGETLGTTDALEYVVHPPIAADITVAALDAAGHKARLTVPARRVREAAGPMGVTCDACDGPPGLSGLTVRANEDNAPSPAPPPRRVRGRVELVAPSAQGAPRDDEVARTLRRRLRAMQACCERELRSDATLSGTVSVRFAVDERGIVASVTVTDTPSAALGECARNTVRRFRFEAGPPFTGEFSLRFAPVP